MWLKQLRISYRYLQSETKTRFFSADFPKSTYLPAYDNLNTYFHLQHIAHSHEQFSVAVFLFLLVVRHTSPELLARSPDRCYQMSLRLLILSPGRMATVFELVRKYLVLRILCQFLSYYSSMMAQGKLEEGQQGWKDLYTTKFKEGFLLPYQIPIWKLYSHDIVLYQRISFQKTAFTMAKKL